MNAAESAPTAPAATAAMGGEEPTGLTATIALHTRLRDEFAQEAERHEQRGVRLSWLRLGTFLAAAVILGGAWTQQSLPLFGLGLCCIVGFAAAVVLHGRAIAAQARAVCRREVHVRHIARATHGWVQFPGTGENLLPRDHPYAWDIDLVGHGSLFQRIAVSHTQEGERTLANWLGSATDTQTARARQIAVTELALLREFRQELEATALDSNSQGLDATRVQNLAHAPSVFSTRAWLRPVAIVLPLLTVSLLILGSTEVVHKALWVAPVALQILLLVQLGPELRHLLDVVSAKAPELEAYKDMLQLLERTRFQSPLLTSLQARVQIDGVQPSAQLARLAFWVGLAELRYSQPFHLVLNSLTLWDVHVAHGIEGFVRTVGTRMNAWFSALAELEALSSFAALSELDPAARMPVLGDERAPLEATAIAHPLLTASSRVANDVVLRGPGTALVVTGSNMAGKSTLLRSLGQNIALALAGAPVIAERMQVPLVRLRASMRADDSLEAGSSYFHAELVKLKRVIDSAEALPPVFFLLDELLRGTNARARHVGAKAVLLHLLQRSATGLCATHDVELAALGYEDPKHIENVHFTDVMVQGEMVFDYRLRPGIVRTSNALRLLVLAGIEVPMADREALEGPSARVPPSAAEHEALE